MPSSLTLLPEKCVPCWAISIVLVYRSMSALTSPAHCSAPSSLSPAFARGEGPASLVWDVPPAESSPLANRNNPDGDLSRPAAHAHRTGKRPLDGSFTTARANRASQCLAAGSPPSAWMTSKTTQIREPCCLAAETPPCWMSPRHTAPLPIWEARLDSVPAVMKSNPCWC